jgi:hypothetical protein
MPAHYCTERGVIQGRWRDSLAENLGLSGAATEVAHLRLTRRSCPRWPKLQARSGLNANLEVAQILN